VSNRRNYFGNSENRIREVKEDSRKNERRNGSAKGNVDCGDGGAKLFVPKRVYGNMGEFGFLRAEL
jgi:transposase-like protein